MWKLRTLPVDYEQYGARLHAKSGVSKLATWIRYTHIDEIPEFWNVLRGEMSVVGPRPERPEFHEQFQCEYKQWDKRLEVKPGMTGVSQVRGIDSTDPEWKLYFDLMYIDRDRTDWWVDIWVLLETAHQCLRRLFNG